MFCKSVSVLTIVISPVPLSPTPSTSSAMKTYHPQSPGSSVSLLENEETSENTEGVPNAPEPAAGGDFQMPLVVQPEYGSRNKKLHLGT
jgi:hypothetical protein